MKKNNPTLKVLSPYDQKLIKEIPLEGKEAIEFALTKAYQLLSLIHI